MYQLAPSPPAPLVPNAPGQGTPDRLLLSSPSLPPCGFVQPGRFVPDNHALPPFDLSSRLAQDGDVPALPAAPHFWSVFCPSWFRYLNILEKQTYRRPATLSSWSAWKNVQTAIEKIHVWGALAGALGITALPIALSILAGQWIAPPGLPHVIKMGCILFGVGVAVVSLFSLVASSEFGDADTEFACYQTLSSECLESLRNKVMASSEAVQSAWDALLQHRDESEVPLLKGDSNTLEEMMVYDRVYLSR